MRRLLMVLVLVGLAIATTSAYHLLHQDRILYRQAEDHFGRQEYGRAVPLYRAALKAGLVKPDLDRQLARSLLMAGQPEEAVALCEKDLKEYPDRLSSMITLAEVYNRVGRFDEAAGLYRTVLMKHPGDRGMQIHLARALAGSGRFDEAVAVYRQALGESP